MSAVEGRTVAELLDGSDELAREALLDMSADRAGNGARLAAADAIRSRAVGRPSA
jgi:hypothetical protein